MDDFFFFFKKIGFWGILGPPSYGIGATIRIGQEMLCLPYAGFFRAGSMTLWAGIQYNVNHPEIHRREDVQQSLSEKMQAYEIKYQSLKQYRGILHTFET